MVKLQTILIVDDDQQVLHILAEALERMGKCFEIVSASDGREARCKAKEIKVDLLITDLNLPEMDGISLTRYLRKINSVLPVIWITAYANRNIQKEAESMAISQVIEKPFEIAYIRGKARALLDCAP